MSDTANVILEYVKREYVPEGEDLQIDEDTLLITSGIVDSFSMVSLKLFIEKKYGIEIPDRDATPAAFDSVRRIVQLVERLRGPSA